MSGQVRAWCLRHAEAERVTTGMAGAVPMPPLTPQGRAQALAAAQTLAGESIVRIYASPTLRARQTAELMATVLAVDVVAMPDLVEVDVSERVLRTWIVQQDLDGQAADGETGHQAVARVTAAFGQIADAHAGETVAVVGHVAALTVGLGRLCALGPEVWGTPLPHARPFLVEWAGGAWRCLAWPGATDGPLVRPPDPSSRQLPQAGGTATWQRARRTEPQRRRLRRR